MFSFEKTVQLFFSVGTKNQNLAVSHLMTSLDELSDFPTILAFGLRDIVALKHFSIFMFLACFQEKPCTKILLLSSCLCRLFHKSKKKTNSCLVLCKYINIHHPEKHVGPRWNKNISNSHFKCRWEGGGDQLLCFFFLFLSFLYYSSPSIQIVKQMLLFLYRNCLQINFWINFLIFL